MPNFRDTLYASSNCVPRTKKFHLSKQLDSETAAEWYTRVKRLALTCKFAENLNAFILNQFIVGAKTKIYEKLCEETENITCEEALRKAMVLECKMAAKAENKNEVGVNFMKRRKITTKMRVNPTKTTENV